jgi:PAS domain S-box-containing protein
MKYNRKELGNMSVFDFIEKKELESFNETWENVTRGIPFKGQSKGLTKYEDEKWFRSVYTSVNDMYGEVAKVIYLAYDMTAERIFELENRKHIDQIKIQNDKLKLSGMELKKKMDQARSEVENKYQLIALDRSRFESILANSTDLIVLIDQHSKIIYLNNAAEKFWNIQLSKMGGKEISKLFTGDMEDYDSSIKSLFSPGSLKITGERKKVKIRDHEGKWQAAEIMLSFVELTDEVSYSVFISLI